MAYLIFARKYRPQTFDEVVGQEHVVTTLKQAVETGRLAQSFLFTGARGVGKTSMARILAKALNCQKGPTAKPCGKCVPCTEITSGSSLDTLEIDGASNRGIDEIRNLREQVRFKPSSGRFKVYIIDEVHMLTQEAFNALLKTLEEPPEHVKFIFATTEPTKVPVTIISRCQRYHFKPIPLRLLKEKLGEIVESEKLKATDDVLFLLARAAGGSLRDGESLLDQLASFSKGKLTAETALEAFGLTSEETILASIDDLSKRDTESLLRRLDGLIEEGKDLMRFTEELTDTLRHLLIFKTVKAPEKLIEVSDDFFAELKKRRDLFSSDDLLYMVRVLTKTATDLKWSDTPRLLLELSLIQLSTREPLTSLSEIAAELGKLSAGGGTGSAPSAGAPSRPAAASSGVRMPSAPSAPAKSFSTQAVSAASVGASKSAGGKVRAEISPENTQSKPSFSPSAADESYAYGAAEEIAEEPVGASAATAVLERREEPAGLLPTILTIEELWPSVLERVKAKKMSTGNYLAEAEPLEVEGNIIILGMEEELSFHREALERREHSDLVRDICSQVFGCAIGIKVVITKDTTQKVATNEPPATVPPIVEAAAEIFNGRVVRRRTPGTPS